MSVLGTVKQLLEASAASREQADEPTSEGAYWCHDCGERVLDLDVEGDDAPECPTCGDPMTFERSVGTAGCAC